MWPCNNVTIQSFYVTYPAIETLHQLWNIPREPANAFQTKKNKKYTYSIKSV